MKELPKLIRVEVPLAKDSLIFGDCEGCYFDKTSNGVCGTFTKCEENEKHYIFKEKEKCNTTQ